MTSRAWDRIIEAVAWTISIATLLVAIGLFCYVLSPAFRATITG